MAINPDPFYLVRQNAPKPVLTHPEFLSDLALESSGTSRGILFVSPKDQVYKEIGQLVSARCSKLGRSFAFRYADLSVLLEGEHLVRLYKLVSQGRLGVVRPGIFKVNEVPIVIKSVEIMEPQPEKKGGEL